MTKRRVAIWIYDNHLTIAYEQTLLARYRCAIQRDTKQLNAVSKPTLYNTRFASPQLEMFTLDDEQWLKVIRRPPYVPRQAADTSELRQLLLLTAEMAILFLILLG